MKNEGERMAVLETKVNNLDQKITDMAVDVKAIMVTLAKQPSIEAEIIDIRRDIEEMKKSSNLWKWLAPTLTGLAVMILSVTLTFLWMNYIQGL